MTGADFYAAELLVRRELAEGNFKDRERAILNPLLQLSLQQQRTEVWFRKMGELVELSGIDQKHFYGVLKPLLADKVLKHPFERCFVIMPPDNWDPDRRRPANGARLIIELSQYNPNAGQNELFDWPNLDEELRKHFIESALQQSYQGRDENVVHSSGELEYVQVRESGRTSRDPGSAKQVLPAAAPVDRSSTAPAAGQQPKTNQGNGTRVSDYHQIGGIGGIRSEPEEALRTDTTKKVVSANPHEHCPNQPDTTKSVVSTTKSVVVPAQCLSVSTALVSSKEISPNKTDETLKQGHTTKNVVSTTNLVVSAAATAPDRAPTSKVSYEQEAKLLKEMHELIAACVGMKRADQAMADWGGFWRNRYRRYPKLVAIAVDRLRSRIGDPIPFTKGPGYWLCAEYKRIVQAYAPEAGNG